MGGFTPKCDDKGNYEPLQSHGSSGYRWCVNTTTGHIIDGTESPPGIPLDCTKRKEDFLKSLL